MNWAKRYNTLREKGDGYAIGSEYNDVRDFSEELDAQLLEVVENTAIYVGRHDDLVTGVASIGGGPWAIELGYVGEE